MQLASRSMQHAAHTQRVLRMQLTAHTQHATQHAACITQHATCSPHAACAAHATYGPHTTCNPTCSLHHAACNMQPTRSVCCACNLRPTHNMQPNMQLASRSMQHAAHTQRVLRMQLT